ncbi:MAG: ATP-binding protein [Bacteroidales bacterium]
MKEDSVVAQMHHTNITNNLNHDYIIDQYVAMLVDQEWEVRRNNKIENLIITGATGTGKIYLAQALGHQACMMLMKTKYYNTARLMDHFKLSRLEGNYTKSL